MLSYFDTRIQALSIHHIGRKSESDGPRLSQDACSTPNHDLHETLLEYFFSSFKTPEFYCFSSPTAGQINALFQISDDIFNSPESLHEGSKEIANYLFEKSDHPKIKAGELLVAYLKEVVLGDEMLDAIGIFKSESKHAFLKLKQMDTGYEIRHDRGMPVDKLDKGCLIFNTNRSDGFRICIVDRVNTASEAQFWKSDFLNVEHRVDSWFNTAQHIQMTKSFIDERLTSEHAFDKMDEADILQRSNNYFQEEAKYDDRTYAQALFQNSDMQQGFHDYKAEYASEHALPLNDTFDISTQALKKYSGIFKSVLKLDKNFHVYIHGDRNMIKHGTEPDGRKYYKLYYDSER